MAQIKTAGTRATLLVKVVEVVVAAECKGARVCQALVADETACVLCLATGGNVEQMMPGSLLSLHNALVEAVPDHEGRTTLMLKLDRFAKCGPATGAGDAAAMLVSLAKNISYTEHELVVE